MPSDDVLLTGEPGELVERFCYALDQLGKRNAVGLQMPLAALAVDIRNRVEFRNFDPAVAVRAVAHRALRLLDAGLGEDFLVTALRNRVTAVLRSQTDTASADQNRADTRSTIEHLLDQPDLLRSRMDAHLSANGAADRSDEEIRRDLQRIAELMSPISADEAVRAWSAFEAWEKIASESLSDDQIDHWRDRRNMKMTRQREE